MRPNSPNEAISVLVVSCIFGDLEFDIVNRDAGAEGYLLQVSASISLAVRESIFPLYHSEHLIVYTTIACKGLAGKYRGGRTFEVCDNATGLAHYEVAGCHIPCLQVVFPKAIETATGNPTQVYSG